MICKWIFYKLQLICLHTRIAIVSTVKLFQLLFTFHENVYVSQNISADLCIPGNKNDPSIFEQL